MKGWQKFTLGDFIALQRGHDLPTQTRGSGEVPVMGSFGITGYHHEAKAKGPGVTVGRSGASIGTVSYVEVDYWPLNTCMYVTDFKGNDPRFVYHFLPTLNLARFNSGSAQPSLNRNYIYPIEICVPHPNEQSEIAAVLGALDDKIELNRKTAAVLEEMARALYRSWFVDFDPVWAKAEGRPPAHMDTATAALFPDGFDDAGLPLGWAHRRLGDSLVLNYGKALKKELREPGQFPVYGSGGSGTTHREALISEPTIIVGRKGTVGSLRWAPDGCWPIDTAFFVTSTLPMSFVMRTLQDLPLSEMNTDAAVPGLNRDNVYRLEVVTPPDQVIAAFDRMAGIWQSKIDSLEKENQTLAILRDSLLPRLMSGELRVGAAREILDEVA